MGNYNKQKQELKPPTPDSTADLVLKALENYGLKKEASNEFRSNRPWSSGSDSMGLTVTIEAPEHGAYYDHVAGEGGSLYELAERLGIPNNRRSILTDTKRMFTDLEDYAHAHGVSGDVFNAAGWTEVTHQNRPALKFGTISGDRWRFLDGEKPKFKSGTGYHSCWYGLLSAVNMCKQSGQPLVICNGEPSVVVAQHLGVAACAVTGGEHRNIKPDLLGELQEAWSGEIFIAPDCDDTGHRMAEGYLRQFREVGYQVCAVDLNGGKGFDLADFCALHKEDSFAQMPGLKELDFQHQDETPNEQTSSRFVVHWASEAFDHPIATEFVVEGLITAGSVNLCVGEGGTKKTWAMMDLGVVVARGEKWLDFNTHQCGVLFVDEESGPKRFLRRLHEVLHGHFADAETPFAFISLAQLNLRELEEANELHVLIEQTSARLVVIDALADIMPGADENAVKDVQPIFLALRTIAEATGAAIVIIHHANKAGGYRGSTALKGAVDLLLMIESKPKSAEINFKVEKARDIEPIEFSAVANFATDAAQFWLSPSEKVERPKLGKAQEYVIRYLAKNGPAPMTCIKAHADTCSSNGAKMAVYSLTDQGYTQRVDDGGPGEKATYDLTEKGKLYADIQV